MSTMENDIKLTQYSRGAGCGCKIAPAVLKEILASPDDFPPHPDLLVGYETSDDAAVLDTGGEQLLIATTDFFMPVVDDAFDFGRIAATNALSDVYAMGGTPTVALAILGWPVEKLTTALAARVMEGARFMCRMAGIPLAGGHSIDAPEPFFGLAVNGRVERENLKKNNTAQPGDFLFLTKPLGNGITTTAAKRGLAEAAHLHEAITYMCTLNKAGEALGRLRGVHAMTDITGFGLLGHLAEMCEGSGTSAQIDFNKVPVFPWLKEYTDKFIYPDMTTKNYSAVSAKVNSLSAQQLFTLCDPQTSGGLLVAVHPAATDDYATCVRHEGLPDFASRCIGRITDRSEPAIRVVD